jgi:serine/threonine protein kinase
VRHHCSVCQRSFDEPGFCPFDGTPLVADKQTLLSVSIPAQSNPTSDTEPERRGTFPLTPTPAAEVSLRAIATTGTTETSLPRGVPGAEGLAAKLHAVSASADPAAAAAALKAPRESAYDRLVGQTLDGRYVIEAKIGEGGMGVVFSARHAVIERPLAIKVLKREVMRDAATIRRFVQEAQAASRIGHPNIVDVTDFGTTPDGMTYSVMEFVVGHTLGSAIKHGAPFAPQRAVKIAAQIARALGAAHDKGIIHRDLKPENVFLIDREGRTDFVKIVDFGIAKVTPSDGAGAQPRLTKVGSVFGTPEYMAPEQAAGRSDTDGRVDVYALGVLLYEMLTGQVPHRSDTAVRTLAMQMLDPIKPPSAVRPDLQIPPALETVVMTALAKKRDDRFQTMAELLDALEKVLTLVGQSITGSPVYALSPVPPGADPSAVAAEAVPTSRSVSPANRPRTPTNRRSERRSREDKDGRFVREAHEPEFTSEDRPADFEHVFTSAGEAARVRRWPFVFAALVAAGAVATLFMIVRSREHAEIAQARNPDGGRSDHDAAVITQQLDGRSEPPADATEVVLVEPDAGIRARPRRDAGAVTLAPFARTVTIQVVTKPEGANLFARGSYRGPGGANIEEPMGTKLDVECKMPGYKPGTVHLVFDGTTEYALCELKRNKLCINNIKNPFDDCELDPNAPMPDP